MPTPEETPSTSNIRISEGVYGGVQIHSRFDDGNAVIITIPEDQVLSAVRQIKAAHKPQ